MRIAYVTHACVPSRAANAVQTLKMVDALCTVGHEVVLYSRPGDDVDIASAFGVQRHLPLHPLLADGPRGLRTPRWLIRLRRQVRDFAPEVIYSRDLLSLCAVADLDVPMCFEAHWSPRDVPHLRAALLALTARRNFVRIVAISRALRDELLALFPGLAPQSVVVVASAADDVSLVSPISLAGQGRLCVGYAGQLYDGKGAELLAPIASRLPDVDFHVVGGEKKDVARWRALAPSNVTFHGHRPHSEVPSFLAAFDVVLAPYQPAVVVSGGAEVSRWMSPLKVFEYMAMSKAIVASDLPVLRECLVDQTSALLVDASDAASWCAAIERLRDVSLRERLGAEARRAFVAGHTWPQRARLILQDLPSSSSTAVAFRRAWRCARGAR